GAGPAARHGNRGTDRPPPAHCRAPYQGSGPGGRRRAIGHRADAGTARFRAAVRYPGPEGRHACLPGTPHANFQGAMSMQGDIQHIGVVGSGAMGRGIAQAAALSGAQVLLVDADQGIAQAAHAAIAQALDTEVAKGRLAREKADGALDRLRVAAGLASLKNAQLVIEAITEDLDAKRRL